MGRIMLKMLGVMFFMTLWATSAWCLVTSPALDEQVPAGSEYLIGWDAIPGATAYNVFVSYDNKVTWEKINGIEKVRCHNVQLVREAPYQDQNQLLCEGRGV